MILGLTGKFAAGKGEAAEFFKGHGFAYFSLSDILREELQHRHLETSRENLIATGQQLRREEGPAVLAQRAEIRLKVVGGNCIVDSIRSPFEVEALRALPGFFLLGIDAPPGIRFTRLQARGRAGDSGNLEDFNRQERAEDTADPHGQQLSATLKLADEVILNDASRAEFHTRLEDFLRRRHTKS